VHDEGRSALQVVLREQVRVQCRAIRVVVVEANFVVRADGLSGAPDLEALSREGPPAGRFPNTFATSGKGTGGFM
jgi:hypothetical protein